MTPPKASPRASMNGLFSTIHETTNHPRLRTAKPATLSTTKWDGAVGTGCSTRAGSDSLMIDNPFVGTLRSALIAIRITYSAAAAAVIRCRARVCTVSVRESSARRYPAPIEIGRSSRDADVPWAST